MRDSQKGRDPGLRIADVAHGESSGGCRTPCVRGWAVEESFFSERGLHFG